MKEEKYYVVYGNEENMYEECIKEFDTYEEAIAFAKEEEVDVEEDGYEFYFEIAKGESEKESSLEKIRSYRKSMISKRFRGK